MKNVKEMFRYIAVAMTALMMLSSTMVANAKENVVVSIISVSIYGAWYIVNEKGFADNIDINVQIIEDLTARNAGITSGDIQCIMTTMDSTVVTAAADVPIKHVAVPLMSYGLDKMIAVADLKADADLKGRSYAADYGFFKPYVDVADVKTCWAGLRRCDA